jgi:hypothetical protein
LALELEGRWFDSQWCQYFLWVKATDVEGWQPYQLHMLIVLKSGSLKLLELSEPVQACTGIGLLYM